MHFARGHICRTAHFKLIAPEQRRHEIPPLIDGTRQPQRHRDDSLAHHRASLQSREGAIEKQVASVRRVRREAGEPDGDVEESFERQKRPVLVGVDQDGILVDPLGLHVDGECADGGDADQKIRPA